MTTAQDTVAQAAAYLDARAKGSADASNYFAQAAAADAQTAAALRGIVWDTPLPTLSLAGPGDITPSTTAETDVSATLALSAPTDHPVAAGWTLAGDLAGDFAEVSGRVTIWPGQPSAPIPLRVAPLKLTADRAPVSLALADITGASPPFPAPVSITLHANTQAKGTLTFPAPIGTVLRDPAAETIVSVQVAREGVSTRDPATIPVVNVTLPPAILKVVGPAVFGADQRVGYAQVILKPYGTSLAAALTTKAKRTPGRAALVATPDFDLGANATQDFVVQDGQDVVTGPNPFRDRVPAEALQALPFPFGWSMNWKPDDVAAWIALTGRRPYVCSGGSHDGGRIATWDACMGGPGGQTDYKGTNFAVAMAVIPRGGGLFVPTWYTTPTSGRGSYAALAGSSQYHDRAAAFGRAACAMMVAAGKDPGQLCPRWDKELNQDPSRSPNGAGEVPDYAAALATFIDGFNQGYTATQPVKPLHIIGLARHDQVGPLEAWVPKGKDGKSLAAGLDISAHLPDAANSLASHPVAEQAAATRQWLRGGYDGRPCYSHDHADPKFSGKVVCQKYGMAMCHSETSPRNEENMACTISAGFWLGMFGFWKENAPMMGPVGVFETSAIKPSSIPGWADGIAMLGKCAKGG